MRHGKKFNHLSRTKAHRTAMLSNMACSLIQHKRINTTLAKAKALRKYIEPLITKSKTDTTHSRRVVFSYLQNKEAASELFREVAPKINDRPGGYTRIIKLNNRLGDNAQMAMIELVDFNELLLKETSTKKKTRRRGGGKKKAAGNTAEVATENSEITDAQIVEDVVDDAPKVIEEVKSEPIQELDASEVIENSAVEDSVEEVKSDKSSTLEEAVNEDQTDDKSDTKEVSGEENNDSSNDESKEDDDKKE
jgi:large subunit ribosomal protein L17